MAVQGARLNCRNPVSVAVLRDSPDEASGLLDTVTYNVLAYCGARTEADLSPQDRGVLNGVRQAGGTSYRIYGTSLQIKEVNYNNAKVRSNGVWALCPHVHPAACAIAPPIPSTDATQQEGAYWTARRCPWNAAPCLKVCTAEHMFGPLRAVRKAEDVAASNVSASVLQSCYWKESFSRHARNCLLGRWPQLLTYGFDYLHTGTSVGAMRDILNWSKLQEIMAEARWERETKAITWSGVPPSEPSGEWVLLGDKIIAIHVNVFKFANERRAALGLPIPPRNPVQRPMMVDMGPLGGGPGGEFNDMPMEVVAGHPEPAVAERLASSPAVEAQSPGALPPAPVPSSCSYMGCSPQKRASVSNDASGAATTRPSDPSKHVGERTTGQHPSGSPASVFGGTPAVASMPPAGGAMDAAAEVIPALLPTASPAAVGGLLQAEDGVSQLDSSDQKMSEAEAEGSVLLDSKSSDDSAGAPTTNGVDRGGAGASACGNTATGGGGGAAVPSSVLPSRSPPTEVALLHRPTVPPGRTPATAPPAGSKRAAGGPGAQELGAGVAVGGKGAAGATGPGANKRLRGLTTPIGGSGFNSGDGGFGAQSRAPPVRLQELQMPKQLPLHYQPPPHPPKPPRPHPPPHPPPHPGPPKPPPNPPPPYTQLLPNPPPEAQPPQPSPPHPSPPQPPPEPHPHPAPNPTPLPQPDPPPMQVPMLQPQVPPPPQALLMMPTEPQPQGPPSLVPLLTPKSMPPAPPPAKEAPPQPEPLAPPNPAPQGPPKSSVPLTAPPPHPQPLVPPPQPQSLAREHPKPVPVPEPPQTATDPPPRAAPPQLQPPYPQPQAQTNSPPPPPQPGVLGNTDRSETDRPGVPCNEASPHAPVFPKTETSHGSSGSLSADSLPVMPPTSPPTPAAPDTLVDNGTSGTAPGAAPAPAPPAFVPPPPPPAVSLTLANQQLQVPTEGGPPPAPDAGQPRVPDPPTPADGSCGSSAPPADVAGLPQAQVDRPQPTESSGGLRPAAAAAGVPEPVSRSRQTSSATRRQAALSAAGAPYEEDEWRTAADEYRGLISSVAQQLAACAPVAARLMSLRDREIAASAERERGLRQQLAAANAAAAAAAETLSQVRQAAASQEENLRRQLAESERQLAAAAQREEELSGQLVERDVELQALRQRLVSRQTAINSLRTQLASLADDG